MSVLIQLLRSKQLQTSLDSRLRMRKVLLSAHSVCESASNNRLSLFQDLLKLPNGFQYCHPAGTDRETLISSPPRKN